MPELCCGEKDIYLFVFVLKKNDEQWAAGLIFYSICVILWFRARNKNFKNETLWGSRYERLRREERWRVRRGRWWFLERELAGAPFFNGNQVVQIDNEVKQGKSKTR